MTYGLPPHLHIAVTCDSVIVLDTLQDRYRRLGDHDERVIRAVVESDEAALCEPASLQMEGLIIRGGRRVAASRVLPPTSSAIELSLEATTSIRNVSTLLLARLRLRLHGLAPVLTRIAAQQRRRASTDGRGAPIIASAFERLRTTTPLTRKCLPDAFALAAILDREGIEGSFVIGVRDAPFAAHAWVQTGTMVLTDPLDIVRELSPILVL